MRRQGCCRTITLTLRYMYVTLRALDSVTR
jgi:hypothetical protein